MEIIAHRGASLAAPEHTEAAFDLAVVQGADRLEIDLRLTADRDLVAVHDLTLERTGGSGVVANLTREDLLRMAPEVRPLRLRQILRRYTGMIGFLLELKNPQPPIERRLLRALDQFGLRDEVVVQSFDEAGLRRLAAMAPDVDTALLRLSRPVSTGVWLDQAEALGVAAVSAHHSWVDLELVLDAADRGLDVRAWTVNDPHEARRLERCGVRGVITDAPGLVREALSPALA